MRNGWRLGIDLGGTQVKLALVDERGGIRELQRVETDRRPTALVAALKKAVTPWLRRPLRGTGVGVAGDVDPVKGVVRFAPNLRWNNVPLAALFKKHRFPRPLFVENDANAAAWGAYHLEFRRRVQNLVAFTLGTGVGGGLILGGRLYRGASGTAGELGHMVIEADGAPCACGNRGCLEAYLGGAAMVAWARREYRRAGRAVGELDPKILENRARAGDRVARAAWRRASRAFGVALANVLNIFNPEAILLAGGVARGAPLFLPAARKVMAARAFGTPARAVQITVSRRSADLGVAGAALLVP